FSSSFGVTEEITVLKEWKTSEDIDQTYQAYKSQPFDGVLGLSPTDIAQYSMSFEKTCANDTTTDAGVLTINGLDEHGCDSFVFFENTLGYNCGIMSVACSLVSVHNVSDYSGTVRTAVIANLPYIYLPTATFNRLNAVYNATKVGDVYVVDCRADMGPLQLWFGGHLLYLNYSDLVETIDEQLCAFRVRPSTGTEVECADVTIDFILGLPFLQCYCVAADTNLEAQLKVGLANRTKRESRVCNYRGSKPITTLAPTTPRHSATAPSSQVVLMPGFIVIIIVASCAILFCVAATTFYCYRRRKKLENANKLELSRMPHYVGPAASFFSAWMFKPRLRDPFEIAEDELFLSTAKQIGSGAFAKVFVVDVKKSLEKRLNERALGSKIAYQRSKVVVKAARHTLEEAKREMLQEIELMKEIGSHPHVVSFIGYVALECPLIVMEYCAEGDLLNYLRTHLQTHKESIAHIDEYLQSARYSNSGISLKDLISLCWQVADGMRATYSAATDV
ncbi:kinase domain protein, partial [Aphelenchoides avenae]